MTRKTTLAELAEELLNIQHHDPRPRPAQRGSHRHRHPLRRPQGGFAQGQDDAADIRFFARTHVDAVLSEHGLTKVARTAVEAGGEAVLRLEPVKLESGKGGRVDLLFHRYLHESQFGSVTMPGYAPASNGGTQRMAHPLPHGPPNLPI